MQLSVAKILSEAAVIGNPASLTHADLLKSFVDIPYRIIVTIALYLPHSPLQRHYALGRPEVTRCHRSRRFKESIDLDFGRSDVRPGCGE